MTIGPSDWMSSNAPSRRTSQPRSTVSNQLSSAAPLRLHPHTGLAGPSASKRTKVTLLSEYSNDPDRTDAMRDLDGMIGAPPPRRSAFTGCWNTTDNNQAMWRCPYCIFVVTSEGTPKARAALSMRKMRHLRSFHPGQVMKHRFENVKRRLPVARVIRNIGDQPTVWKCPVCPAVILASEATTVTTKYLVEARSEHRRLKTPAVHSGTVEEHRWSKRMVGNQQTGSKRSTFCQYTDQGDSKRCKRSW